MTKHSFSSIKTYVQCPRQYHEIRVLKRWPKAPPTDEQKLGEALHLAFENYIVRGTLLEARFLPYKPYLDAVMFLPGKVYGELKMALTALGEYCEWDDARAHVIGIADYVRVHGSKGVVLDWKTGSSKYPDEEQLELMSLMLMAKHPEIESVDSGLVFVLHDDIRKRTYTRNDIEWLVRKWCVQKPAMIEGSRVTDDWPAKSSALCPWCPVTTCEFWRPKPVKRK